VLRELEIKNFRSVVETKLPLEPLSVLIGPNNAGKTNLLRAIQVLSHATINLRSDGAKSKAFTTSFPYPFHTRNRQAGEQAPSELVATTDSGKLTCRLAQQAGQLGGSVTVQGPAGEAIRADDPLFQKILGELRSSDIYSFEPSAARRPVSMQMVREIRRERPASQRRSFAADGTGLAGVLFALQSDWPERWDTLIEEFRVFVPGIKRINFGENEGNVSLTYWEEGQRSATPIEDVSDGIVLLTALLALRFSVDNPAIVLLEDPERGVHPRRLHEVTSTLIELSEGSEGVLPIQTIMTSHSPYFLDRFRDAPKSIVLVERPDQRGTQCVPLPQRLNDLPELKNANLGELWYSGVLGGVPREVDA